MFEQQSCRPLFTDRLREFIGELAELDGEVDDAGRIDQIRLLEELKAAASAAQARVTARFAASQRTAQIDAGVKLEDVGKGIAAQVGLAKREAPARARRYVGWASILVAELPNTLALLQQGRITEWRAQIVARETGWLSADHRAEIDAQLAPKLEALGDRAVEAETKRLAYRLDPHGYLARISKAEGERRVTLRPAPDTMSVLSGILPVVQGVSVLASLTEHADSLRSQGDQPSRGQIMADTLVQRVTGQASAEAVPVEVRLVMTDQTLLNCGEGSSEPAHVDGYGPIPAELARRLARTGGRAGAAVAAPAVHRPRHRCPGRDGVAATPLPRWPRRHVDRARPDMPDPLVRRTHPAHRSRQCRRSRRGGPPKPTGKDSAKRATTPNKHPAGEHAQAAAAPARKSTPPPPPDTATAADHPHCRQPHAPPSRMEKALIDLIWAA